MMNIFLNGERYNLTEKSSISQLLEHLQLRNKRIAVEYNLDIIPKSQHADIVLQTDDRIEIVHAIGGG